MRTTIKVTSFLFAGLFATSALAEGPVPVSPYPDAAQAPAPGPSLRRDGVALSTSQLLLWDPATGQYQLFRLGDTIDGAQLVGVDNGRLVLQRGDATEVIELAPPPQLKMSRRFRKAIAAQTITAPVDAPVAAPAPVVVPAPLAAPAPVVAPAPVPLSAGAQGTSVAPAPVAPPVYAVAPSTVVVAPPPAPMAPPPAMIPPAPPAPIAPAPVPLSAGAQGTSAAPAPVVAPAPVIAPYDPAPTSPAPVAAPAPVIPPYGAAPAGRPDDDSALLLPRAELNAELGRPDMLSTQAQVVPAPGGGFRLADLRAGSYLESLGLKSGDVVQRIDGRPINTLAEAARATAWVRVTDHFTVDIVRDGAPLQLRYQVGG